MFINKFSFSPSENSYLVLKSKLNELFGPIGKIEKKYPPVVLNKNTPQGSFCSVEEFFSKPFKGSKKFRRILHRPQYEFPTDPWQKTLNDFSINRDLIKKSFIHVNSKVVSPSYHDRKLRLLQRKTQFRDQLSKHIDIPYYCEWCKDNLGFEEKETFLHGVFSCPKLYDGPDLVLQHLKIDQLLSDAVTATDIVLYPQTGDIALDTVLSAIYTIYLYFVLQSRDSNSPFDPKAIANHIRLEISSINTVYFNRPLARRSRDVGIGEFLASHEIGMDNGTNNIPIDQIISRAF